MFLHDPYDTAITLAEPSQGEPFSFSMHDVFRVDPKMADAIGQAGQPDWMNLDRDVDRFRAGVVAAERQTRLVEIITARENALAEAEANRIETVRRLTGVQLENPFEGGYAEEANRRVNARGLHGNDRDAARAEERRNIFNEKIGELKQSFPEHAGALDFFGQPLEDQATAIAKGAAYDGEHSNAGVFASLIGGLWGSRRDPLFIASLFFGPEASAAKTVIGKIGMGALSSALYNAGLQALAQPAVQQWRAEIGERHGVYPALENVGMAALIGAVPGAAIEGIRALAQPAKAALGRMVDGTASPADVETAAKGLGVTLDDDTRRALNVAADDTPAQAAAIGDRPPGIPEAEHETIAAQAVRHAEDPANNPPPDIPIVAPERAADQARLIDEALPGESQRLDGKPVTFGRFDPNELGTDAAAFQYKGGGDAAGVTDRLRNVEQWDPLASGKTLVFERADGTKVIADGHQRLGLAKRLSADDGGIRLDGYLFRAADGWTPEDVRAIAAKKNMQEGSGDAIDAARVLRDRPDLLDASLPVSSPMMKNAVALSRLSDEAFGMAINGVVPPNYAAAVGGMVSNKLQHAAVLADLAKFKPETEREARVLIGEVMAAGFRAAQQINLFGATDATRSLMGERVKILDIAMAGLSRDKKLFGTLAEKADAIEAAGNQLVRAGNDRRARDAAQLGELLAKLARVSGPVSDALNRAAARMADGGLPKAKASDAFLDEVRALLDRDGLVGLLAPPELKPALKVEPASKEALTAAETANGERLVETRGTGTQFHGSSLPDLEPSSEHYSTLNYYGQGFYTTDAIDIAHGYSRRGSQKTGERNVYVVEEKRPLNILDGELPISADLLARIVPESDRGLDGVLASALEENPTSLRQLYDDIREFGTSDGHSADELQELFDVINYQLQELGYDGMSHVGGRLTGKADHKVVIYFNPDQDLTVRKESFDQFRKSAAETAHAARMESVGSTSETAAPTLPENAKTSPRPALSHEDATAAVDDFIIGQAGVTVEQLHVRGQALQAEIAAVGKAAAEESGALFVNPGPKKPERLAEKIARKGYNDASQITDAARGGMIVDTPAQADATVAALAKKFDLVDEGWKINTLGYTDRKILVRDAAGTVGEFQIIPSPMYEAKKGGGQKLYKQARSMAASPERSALEDQQRELYSAASARLGADWTGIFETSSGPNLPSNVRRQASSDITPAVSMTSSSSTATQGAPGLSTANAADLSDVSTAGRQSQLQNVSAMGDSVGASPATDKAQPSLFDSIAVATRDDGRDARFVSRDQALAGADRAAEHADLIASCKD